MLILVSQKFRTGGLAEYTRSDKKGKFLAHHNFKKHGISSAFLAIHGATQRERGTSSMHYLCSFPILQPP